MAKGLFENRSFVDTGIVVGDVICIIAVYSEDGRRKSARMNDL